MSLLLSNGCVAKGMKHYHAKHLAHCTVCCLSLHAIETTLR